MIGLLKYKDNGLNICGADGCKSPTRTPSLKAFSLIYGSASAPFLGLSRRIYNLFCFMATFCGLAPHLNTGHGKVSCILAGTLFPFVTESKKVYSNWEKMYILQSQSVCKPLMLACPAN